MSPSGKAGGHTLLWIAAALVAAHALASDALAGGHADQDASTLRVRLAPSLPSGSGAPSVALSREGDETWHRVEKPGSQRQAVFTALQPGTYVLSIEGPDGASAKSTVRVGPREIVNVRAGPSPAGAIDVHVVNRIPLAEGVEFDERWLDDLPVGGDLWSLIETTAPYVIVDRMDTGGVALGRSGLMGDRGASWTSTSVRFGDVTVLGPNIAGLIPIAPDMSSVRTVSVTSGLAPIEAETPGVLIELTPRRPNNARGASFQASLSEPKMVDENLLPGSPAIARLSTWRQAGAQISVPAGARTGLLVSAAGARSEFYERDLPDVWRAESISGLAHLVSNPTDRDQLRFLATVQRVKYPFEYRRQFADRSVLERGTFLQASGAWDRTTGAGTRTSAALAFQRGSYTPLLNSVAGGTVDRVTDGIVPFPAAATVESALEVKGSIAPPMFSLGGSSHDIRAGLTAGRAAGTSDVLALPTVAELVAGIPARVWIPTAGARGSQRTRLTAAAYIGDRMSLGSSLSIDAGVRADFARGSADGASQKITWTTVSPRGSFHWSLGNFALFGGAGLYTDPLTLSRLAFGDPGETVSDVYRWHDLDDDRRFEAGERGVLVSRKGWGQPIASIDPDLRAPRTYERTLGFELRYPRALTFRAAIIYRDLSNMLASINTGVPLSGYRVFEILDQYTDWDGSGDDQPLEIYDRLPSSFGKDTYLLTNPEGEKATYEGLEFTWKLATSRLHALFGVTAYRTRSWSGNLGFNPLENDHGVIGERLERPNAQPVVQGSYIFDRSYVGKLSASYRGPAGIRIAFAARYQDGQPFSRIVIAPNLAGGAEMIHAYRTGRTRFTYTLTLDVRLAKDFSVAGRRAALELDVFNATRHRNEVEEDVLTTPAFRRSTAMQPPLAARIGVRIHF